MACERAALRVLSAIAGRSQAVMRSPEVQDGRCAARSQTFLVHVGSCAM